MIISDELPPHLQRMIDLGESGTDVMHGELKNWMYDAEQKLSELAPKDTVFEYDYISGYLDALTEVYKLTYNLAFSLDERNKAKNA